MTLAEIANVLLVKRQTSGTALTTGQTIGMLGHEGMREAMDRKWLSPVLETAGWLEISNHPCHIEEMRKEAIQEIMTPGIGASRNTGTSTPTSAGATTAPPAVSPSPTDPRKREKEVKEIGDDVVVSNNGRNFSGKVSAEDSGKLKVSFGNNRPSNAARAYDPKEVKLVKKFRPTYSVESQK